VCDVFPSWRIRADFERLRRIKDIPKADELLARLGAGAVAVLSRIKLDNLTEGRLIVFLKATRARWPEIKHFT